MEAILSKVQLLALQHTSNKAVQDTLTHLSDTEGLSWSILQHDFKLLEEQGLWESTADNSRLLEDLHRTLISAESLKKHEAPRNMSIVQAPPPLHSHPLLKSLPEFTLLPNELLEILNQTHFLHLLATDPSKVVPPGKSILSMMSKTRTHPQSHGHASEFPTLQEKVEEVIHKAFWDEVRTPTKRSSTSDL